MHSICPSVNKSIKSKNDKKYTEIKAKEEELKGEREGKERD